MKNFTGYKSMIILVFISVFVIFGGCAQIVESPADRELRREIDFVTAELKRGMETENVSRIMELIDENYSPSKADLRSRQRDVFRQFTGISLELYAGSFNRANGEVNLQANWNLRWHDTASDEIVLRRGQTTFRLIRTADDQLRIISQRDDILLGEKEPGTETERQ